MRPYDRFRSSARYGTSGKIPSAIFVGVVATVAMDLAAFAQRRLFGIPSLKYAMVGRWLGHIPRGCSSTVPSVKARLFRVKRLWDGPPIT